MWKKKFQFLSLPKQIKEHQKEVIAVIWLGVLVFLTMSCLSFKATEQSPFYFSTVKTAQTNWCGKWGTWAAAWCFYIFGATIFSWILLGFFLLYHFIFRTFAKEIIRKIIAGIFVNSILAAFLASSSMTYFGLEPGGVIGYKFFSYGVERMGHAGTLLFLALSFWLSLLYFLGHSPRMYLYAAYNWCLQRIKKGISAVYALVSSLVYSCYRIIQISLIVPKAIVRIIKNNNFTLFTTMQKSDSSTTNSFSQLQQTFSMTTSQAPHRTSQLLFIFNRPYSWIRNTCFVEKPKEMITDFTPAYQEKETQFSLPNLDTLIQSHETSYNSKNILEEQKLQAERLEGKLLHFGIEGKVTAIHPGPIVTLFEYTPAIGTKISKIIALEDDLAMVLKARSIRIRAPIPGRSVVGFEISNEQRQNVLLSNIVHSDEYKNDSSVLPLALGVDIVGKPIISDLASMPHLLVAGSTGSGKSVGLNAMLTTLLARRKPDELRVILIDPKRLEFAPYRDIPHLLFPIITEARAVAPVLKWVVEEMERRYELLSQKGVRNLFDYHYIPEKDREENLPFIVLVIDELADLMMVAGKEIELLLARISQMARAAGIHMIIATQRPSVDVLTGTIKVNFPSRISFRVSSKVDSKTILDSTGAERLLGRGDSLFMSPSSSELKRIHGAYVSDQEIEALTDFLRKQKKVSYLNLESVIKEKDEASLERIEDELYNDIVHYVKSVDVISISMLQRKYRIGFNRSARIIEQLELHGVIAPAQGGKPRKVIR